MQRLLPLTLIFLSANVLAGPFDKGDAKQGKITHQKLCADCHVAKFGGDGSKIYTRSGRKISNKQELMQRVASCNAMINSGLFPEEEGAIAAWLNQQYYHFKN